ncbi:SWIM zinc finger family protein [Streptomyces formicae]|uniref:SWIM zinc finger family protein n=1 Tax=Streptomyces formicae TaxID=1616117 RepID=A0ABY3WUE9_9ACTN|nr:SWIM zinc finger family protein [Streptomyces formicae]UNM14427.1 SWIM zinc finger family protein [Streptomyces formicae]
MIARRPGVPRRDSPHRPDDRRRTFPQLAPRSGDESFAASWWGNAWVDALEDTALDPARLARGRAYAGRGQVDAITVTPGRVTAYVHGSRPRPYRADIRLRTLGDEDWDRLLDTAAARPDHIAALLDKDVPHALANAADLLPAPGDLIPDCSCPDDGFPCKHAAALCYQTARILDEDPFVLFLMRGRGEQEILAELTRRNATRSAAERAAAGRATAERTAAAGAGRAASGAQTPGTTGAPPALAAVPAREALAPRTLPPLPPPLPVPQHPGRPPVYPQAPGAPDPLALDLLAAEAAARAHTTLTTGRDPIAGLTPWQDAVRLAAAHPGSGLTASTRALYTALARATGRTPTDLARAVAAWRQGGLAGLAVLEEEWDPPAGPFDRARPALAAADFPGFRPRRNRLSTSSLQLRLGRDGLWYGYESDPGRDDWWPRGTPDADPVGALAALLGR